MNLEQELQKEEYLNLTNKERLDLLYTKTVSTVGKIAYGNTLHLVSMLARGLRARIEACPVPELKAAWSEALHPSYLSSPAYSINVALKEIRDMLDAGMLSGICTPTERDFIVQLATYNKPLFPDVTLRDVVKHFNPELINEDWIELPATDSRTLSLQLNSRTPEVTHIVVQMQDLSGAWEHATALHGIQSVRPYTAALPFYGVARKLRWKCEYVLDGLVTAV